MFLRRFTEADETAWEAAGPRRTQMTRHFNAERDGLCADLGPRIVSARR